MTVPVAAIFWGVAAVAWAPPAWAAAPLPLADSDPDWGRLVGFVILAIVWIVGAIAKSTKKTPKQKTWTGQPVDPAQPPPSGGWMPPQGWAPPPGAPQPTLPRTPAAPPPLAVPPHWLGQQPGRPPALPTSAAPPGQKKRRKAARAAPADAGSPARDPAVAPLTGSALGMSALGVRAIGASAGNSSASPAPTAAEIRRWLTPEVVRQQYVLGELLDRPPSDA